MKKDLISVVIPAYNHEQYIEECIDSIINQTYENIELIIVNDGSNDQTAKVIKSKSDECKIRFKRFLFIDKENDGLSKTLNKGLFESKGEFLALCASDDTFKDNALETLYHFLKNNPEYVLAVGDNFFIDDQSKRCYWDSKRKKTYNAKKAFSLSFGSYLQKIRIDVDFNSDQFGTYESLLKGNYITNGYLFRKDVLINMVKGFSVKSSLEDYFLHLQLSKFGKFKYINKYLFNYRVHETNTSKKKIIMIKKNKDTFELEKEYAYKFGFKKIYEKDIKKIIKEKKYDRNKLRKLYDFFIRNIYRIIR